MATEADHGGGEPHASSSNPQPQARVRRRARKRNGPPQFQFLTATDPSQFKDEDAKRSVRSQAMIQYRYNSSQQKRRGKEPKEARPAEKSPPAAERVTPILLNEGTYQNAQDALFSQWLDEPNQPLYDTTAEAWWSANPSRSSGEPPHVPYSTALEPIRPSRYYNALATIPLNLAARRVTDYEDTDDHDALLLRLLVAKVATSHTLGDGLDPFTVIPQFASPELNSVYLVRKCNRVFSSASTLVKWLPAMLSHPHILLSSTIMASTWLDMHEGVSGESRRTVLVKAESIGWINERLRNADTQFEDSTLMCILHILAGEMWSCNERTLRIHEAGVARLIAYRGGMESLGGNGAVAEVAAACCYHGDIICEAPSLPLFHTWEPPVFVADDNMGIPEGPLFRPRKEFFSVIKDPACSEFTYELLCDMRDLTELFVTHEASIKTELAEEVNADTVRQSLSSLAYDAKVAEIRAKLVSLPSAYTQGLPTTHDWVYEACRIAAIIYTAAIIMRVPFSVAAEPTKNAILLEAASLSGIKDSEHIFPTRLTHALYEVMERTNVADIWGDMSGVYYWVTAVGAAAARTPVTINTYSRPNSHSEAYATWVRRCLMMFATRAMVILIFQHPLPIIYMQKKLLKVQELVHNGNASTPAS